MVETHPFAVVTGASRGIGRAVALRFARAGYQVWALARSVDELESLHAEVPDRVRALPVNLADEAALREACKTIVKDGPPSVLVNNAGIAVSAPLLRTSMADYERTMAINVRAPFILCQELVPGMLSRGAGRVINISSTAGVKGFKYTSVYAASKHALVGMTRSLAHELAGTGITVNAVCPGWTDTDMMTRAVEQVTRTTGRTPEDSKKTLLRMTPLGRFIKPEEVAEACLYLASEGSGAITGTIHVVDGGELA